MNARTMNAAYEDYRNAKREFYRLRVLAKADLLNAIGKMPAGTRVDIEELIKVTGLTEKALVNFIINVHGIELRREGKVRKYGLIKEDGTVDTSIVKTETEEIPYIVKVDKVTGRVPCTKDEKPYCGGEFYYANQGNGDEILRLLSVKQ